MTECFRGAKGGNVWAKAGKTLVRGRSTVGTGGTGLSTRKEKSGMCNL